MFTTIKPRAYVPICLTDRAVFHQNSNSSTNSVDPNHQLMAEKGQREDKIDKSVI